MVSHFNQSTTVENAWELLNEVFMELFLRMVQHEWYFGLYPASRFLFHASHDA